MTVPFKAGAIYELNVGLQTYFDLTEERKEGSLDRGDRFLMLEDQKKGTNTLVKVLLLKTNQVVLMYQWRMFWKRVG